MATVTELSSNGGGPTGPGPETKGSALAALAIDLETHQSVAYTGTAGTLANPVNAELVRVIATSDCYITNGVSPTATTADVYLPAGVVEVIKINYGDKVSAIRVSVSGTLHVTELT